MELLQLETIVFQISKLFLWPVMCLILLSLAYALIALGGFFTEWALRAS